MTDYPNEKEQKCFEPLMEDHEEGKNLALQLQLQMVPFCLTGIAPNGTPYTLPPKMTALPPIAMPLVSIMWVVTEGRNVIAALELVCLRREGQGILGCKKCNALHNSTIL